MEFPQEGLTQMAAEIQRIMKLRGTSIDCAVFDQQWITSGLPAVVFWATPSSIFAESVRRSSALYSLSLIV